MQTEVGVRSSWRARTPWALVAVLTLGFLLRAALVLGDWPTARRNRDVYPFVTAAHKGLFSDPLHPAGYPAILRILHWFWGSALFPTLVQHGLGLLAGYLLYDMARRLGAGRLWATVPAAVAVLSIDELATEHLLMSDSLSTFLLVASLWAIVRAKTSPHFLRYAVLSGFLAGAAFTVRATGLALVPWILLAAVWGSWRVRSWLRPVGAVVAGLLLILAPYFVLQHAVTGRWGATQASGWSIYVRAAPFADCNKFQPPPGTQFLCESTPPAQRGGSDFYGWTGGPARAAYGDFRLGNPELNSFAIAALRAQPGDYVDEVGHDFLRYFIWIGPQHSPGGGDGAWTVSVSTLDPPTAEFTTATLETYYGNLAPVRRPLLIDGLGRLQPILRVSTYELSAAILLSIGGAIAARGRRWWILLFTGFTLSTLLLCAATAPYAWRYALPILPIAFLAAALAADSLLSRRPDKGTAAGVPPEDGADHDPERDDASSSTEAVDDRVLERA
jgi:hypothetical protein